jgi:chemotaxis protein CheZ
VQRKVFRIEQMIAGPRTPEPRAPIEIQRYEHAAARRNGDAAGTVPQLASELASIRDTLADNRRDLAALLGDGKERRMARAADELAAANDGMEKATQKILKSVEAIDDSAKALTASLRDNYNRGLAQDIQDQVVEIYEACNFQDIAGQRIGKAIAALTAIEQQVSGMLARCDGIDAVPARPALPPLAPAHSLLNGPRLDSDNGHASQRDIDKMFG